MDCDSWFGLWERVQQFSRIGEAGFGVADEGLVDDGGEGFLQPRHTFADGDGVFVEDDVDGVALGIEAVGEFPGEELVEGGGEAPDIGDGFDVFRRPRVSRPAKPMDSSFSRRAVMAAPASLWAACFEMPRELPISL